MRRFYLTFLLTLGLCQAACVSTPSDEIKTAEPISITEAKSEACPKSILEAGATPEDCLCIESELFALGQKPGALLIDGRRPKALFGDDSGIRKIAIGLLRHDAIENCGLFDPDHEVAKNL